MQTQTLSLFDIAPARPLGTVSVPVRAHTRHVAVSALPDSLPYASSSETSRAAAEAEAPNKASQEARVLGLIEAFGGLSDEQIGRMVAGEMKESSARRQGRPALVRDNGRKVEAASGKMVTVWEAAE